MAEYINSLSATMQKKLWACNDKIAAENHERFSDMDLRKCLTPAILAYDGIQYTYMAPDVLEQQHIDYLQENLRILLGFYGAKLNSEISSDMSYNEICEITGIYKTNPPTGQGLITQNLSSFCNNASAVTATYETSNEAMRHMSGNGYDMDFLKDENPDVMYIIAYV